MCSHFAGHALCLRFAATGLGLYNGPGSECYAILYFSHQSVPQMGAPDVSSGCGENSSANGADSESIPSLGAPQGPPSQKLLYHLRLVKPVARQIPICPQNLARPFFSGSDLFSCNNKTEQ